MRALIAAAMLVAAAPAAAQQTARFCPNRPDLGASTCTTDPGRVLVEVSGIDWQRDERGPVREDVLLFGDLLLRTGLDARTEVQLSWTPYAQVRTRDRAVGRTEAVRGAGDVRLAVRRNLLRPDGDGFSLALEPFVTLPVGARGVGRGDWSAGAVLPVSWELGDWSLGFTGEGVAETNASGDGRHLQVAGTLGLGRDLADGIGAVVELAVRHDDDPQGVTTELIGAGSIAWAVGEHAQIDLLATAGLNRHAPDFRLAVGGAVLF